MMILLKEKLSLKSTSKLYIAFCYLSIPDLWQNAFLLKKN